MLVVLLFVLNGRSIEEDPLVVDPAQTALVLQMFKEINDGGPGMTYGGAVTSKAFIGGTVILFTGGESGVLGIHCPSPERGGRAGDVRFSLAKWDAERDPRDTNVVSASLSESPELRREFNTLLGHYRSDVARWALDPYEIRARAQND